MLANEARHGLQIVEGGDQNLVAQALGDAGGIGDRLREIAGPLRRQAHEPVVAHAVVAALEFQDLVALACRRGPAAWRRASASEPVLTKRTFSAQGTASTISAARRMPYSLLAKKVVPLAATCCTTSTTSGMRMADDHRARAQEIVDVLVAAHVPDVAGPPLGDDDLVRDVAEAAAGQNAPRGLDQLALRLAVLLCRHFPALPAFSVEQLERR